MMLIVQQHAFLQLFQLVTVVFVAFFVRPGAEGAAIFFLLE